MELEDLKKYLKVEVEDDDTLIESLKCAAEEYLLNAGIKSTYENNLYMLAIKLLVSHWYQNRCINTDKSQIKLTYTLDAIITQLRL